MMLKFVSERLVSREVEDKPVKSFCDLLHRSRINTMTYMKKSVNSGKEKVSMDDDMMYLYLLSISVKKVHLKASEVLKIQQ